MKTTTGYSKTPLAKKLGIKEGFSILLVNAPSHYWELFDTIPDHLNIKTKTVGEVDFIHLFCTSFDELQKISISLKDTLKKTGMLWVSWPKGSSKIQTDLKRDPIREHLLSIGLVDTKVAAVDEDWSGLKFVFRLKDRT
ncbi:MULTISPECIES: DUF3052 domain-containing protein [Flavobacteriaceae]|uniref:DUF3052 domain-containing protein n=1 Tax=Flavobacteriaceae TaxID=49546 RepID=UPI001FE4EDDA|nr:MULTISPECIES: DUF3052 domain-containing protein [Allomuricauda]MDC6364677.1 DUF3052 domain-containing protein [Muricauda sp. AC10]